MTNSHNATFTLDEVVEYRKLYAAKQIKSADIAAAHKVSVHTVRDMLAGRTYAWVAEADAKRRLAPYIRENEE